MLAEPLSRAPESATDGDPSPQGVDTRQLAEWASTGANIAAFLDDTELGRIGQRVLQDYQIDKQSRGEKEQAWKDAVDLAKQVSERKNYPWHGASNVKFPALTVASIQFAARSYPAIVRGPEIVKGKVVGSDKGVPQIANGQPAMQQGPEGPVPVWQIPPGAKQARADRIAEHMSYQLAEEMEEWEEDTDKLLHTLPVYGCAFRKTWFDPELQRPRSKLVQPEDLVVNAKAETLERSPRTTEHIPLYRSEIIERQRMGIFLDVNLNLHEGEDREGPYLFLEQHRTYDLDEDGYPEPYICTVHKDSGKVVRIVARFDADGILTANDNGEIVKIEPVHYYTKYAFVPAPDGCFYDLGFADLLGPLNRSINTTINQLLDAGHLQNTGGGFISSDLEIKAGNQRFRPGEWKRIQTNGANIRDSVFPLPAAEPSPVLFQLLGLLIEAANDVAGTQDVLSGEMKSPQQSPTTTLALIEQGLKVFTAIHKRVYRAMKGELRKLRRINSLFLTPQHYQMILDDPRAGPQDYSSRDFDVVPVADPEMVTDIQRAARSEALLQFANDPWFDAREIRVRYLRDLGIEGAEDLVAQQPPPNPVVMAEADKIDVEKRKAEIDAVEAEASVVLKRAQAIKAIADAEGVEAGAQMDWYRTQIEALKARASMVSAQAAMKQAEQPEPKNDA